MRVEINCLEPGCEILTYTVESEAECHDEVDRFAYRHVVESGQEVRVGCVVASPARKTVVFARGVKVPPVGGIGYAWPDDQQENEA